jgi:hypothetical protein
MTHPITRIALAAGTAAALLLPTALAGADATSGALAVTPAVIERTAVRGDAAPIMVVNSTGKALKITVTPRPWTQSRSGAVAPNRHKTLLSTVGVSARSFTLAAGERKSVTLTVKSVPSAGSVYGSVETIGLPTGPAKKTGITAAYRLVSSLRLNPTAAKQRLKVKASAVKLKGRAIALPVKNTGNTVGPVSGDVRIKGAAGSRSADVKATPILPGSTVDLPLGSTKGLPAGRYTVSVTLKQGGKSVLKTSRTLRVK